MKSRSGFTIVELLIVIVVIAILAAITIVAYNGIQQRADISSMQAGVSQLQKSIELVKAEKDTYPSAINSCPAPVAGAACLQIPNGYTADYIALPQGARPNPVYAGNTLQPSYELTLKSSKTVVYKSLAERTGANEFMQYMDMAPIIDQFGLRPYQISFDVKSANIASSSAVSIYMQNGSGAKYSFNVSFPVTTSYVRRTVTVMPTVWMSGEAASVLAFYGMYSTGNIPTVKNLEIMLAN